MQLESLTHNWYKNNLTSLTINNSVATLVFRGL